MNQVRDRLRTYATRSSQAVRPWVTLHTIVALVVFVAGLAATTYYWHNLRESVRDDMQSAYQRQLRTLGNATNSRLQLYENFLRGSAGLFTIHTGTTQEDWGKYHQPYEIRRKYPDIEGIGVSRYLTKAEVPAYLERRAAQGDPDFKIYPEGDREVYVPVTFNAQYTGNNGAARGFDGYTDQVRRKAMDAAVAEGGLAMSGVVQLVSESRGDRQSFILYHPLYRTGASTKTAEQRKQALLGFVYIAVDMKTLLDEVLRDSQSPYVGLRIYDASSKELAYESANFEAVTSTDDSFVERSNIDLYGHKWQMVFAVSPEIISLRERQLPSQALWRGLLSCILFASLVWYLITDRERKYARQKQQEVQTAKDDLLSLASHQLRTPATVVKQYVGMLLQGYGGQLTDRQVAMLNNAYESNERQLEIINQLLYVARLDAGRITLHKQEVDIVQLLREVAHDQAEGVAQHHHRLTFKVPKRPLRLYIDPHYVRMVLENLLSNAIKYTPDGGRIRLTLQKQGPSVVVTVADTGVGISPAAQPTIFDKFTRVENELSTDVNGSGVGLYLTQQIVALHNGTITVTSEPGEGSAFTITLPYGRDDTRTAHPEESAA